MTIIKPQNSKIDFTRGPDICDNQVSFSILSTYMQ